MKHDSSAEEEEEGEEDGRTVSKKCSPLTLAVVMVESSGIMDSAVAASVCYRLRLRLSVSPSHSETLEQSNEQCGAQKALSGHLIAAC